MGHYGMGGRSYGGFSGSRGVTARSGGFVGNRNPGSFGNQSSNFHSAINDGNWHSFGNSRSAAASSFAARNGVSSAGGWRSFGPSPGASSAGAVSSRSGGSTFRSGSVVGSNFNRSTIGSFRMNSRFETNTSLLGVSRFGSFGNFGGRSFFGNRGFSSGLGWHGNSFFCRRPGFGWGGRFFGGGIGWGGWGFGFGWPYWGGYGGPYWSLGWDPWWYNPYWYAPYWYSPWPAYGYGANYNYNGYDDPLSYNSDASPEPDSQASYLSTPSLNRDTLQLNLASGADQGDAGADRNDQTPQPEAAPNGAAPSAQPEPKLISQPQT